MNRLEETYAQIDLLAKNFQIEDFKIVKLVEDYRNYWKPIHVKTILLAESHVYTERKHLRTRHCLGLPNYPQGYVRFVYNLAYGQSNILNERVDNNRGTPQFWKLFNDCADKEFHVTQNPNPGNKLAEKIKLLNYLKDSGIWLLDCSIVGIYNQGMKPEKELYEDILKTSFDNYCTPIIRECKPENIIVIGKSVFNTVGPQLSRKEYRIDWIHQPNARLSNAYRRGIKDLSFEP